MTWRVIEADCIEAMAEMDEASVDAIVTDPPYGLEFMGKEWDSLNAVKNGNPALHPDGSRNYQHDGRDSVGGRLSRTAAPPTPKKNPRCRRCGKTKWNHDASRCQCEQPDWDTRTAEFGRDMQAWHQAWAEAALRVLKPGGHLLAFGGTRTYHRLTCALEDAGFEIRDCLAWLYGSGFPKSLDVSKAIDKANGRQFEDRYALGREGRACREAVGLTAAEVNAWFGYKDGCQHWECQDASGARVPTLADFAVLRERLGISEEHLALVERAEAEREVIGVDRSGPASVAYVRGTAAEFDVTAPATPDAEQWQGWGTALKPAFEPIVLARKPLTGTVAANVLEHGTGALNIDGTRIAATAEDRAASERSMSGQAAWRRAHQDGAATIDVGDGEMTMNPAGRWPANVILDEEAAAMLDEQSGESTSQGGSHSGRKGTRDGYGFGRVEIDRPTDFGGASRFFYVPKADREERNRGLEHRVEQRVGARTDHENDGRQWDIPGSHATPRANIHPTVKPVALMAWLCRLVTPPHGTVLDPFTGSGTTGLAALREGFDFIGIERDEDYCSIARDRIIGDAPMFNVGSELLA